MADISDVDTGNIKDLYEKLESLACLIPPTYAFTGYRGAD